MCSAITARAFRSPKDKPDLAPAHYNHHRMSPADRRREEGYVLLVLLLFVAVLSIGFWAMVRKLDFQIKRDREEEMIHRGVQYSRAIKHYFKKFGRYPTRIEDLENTNNIRFLRKRYKDPITGKDFKLLHLTDLPQLSSLSPTMSNVPVGGFNNLQSSSPAVGGGTSFVSAAAGNLGPGNPSSFAAQQPGAPGALTGAPGALNGMTTAPASPGPGPIGGPSPPADQTDPSAANQANSSGSGLSPTPQPLSQQIGPTGAPQVFGGGAIIGVASVSKEQTIREFNKKNHYNQWQFVYDPTSDKGGLLMTPYQPSLQGAVPASQMQPQSNSGQPGFSGANPGFGTSQPSQPPASPSPPQP
jgi:hypothetical protein